MFADHLFVLGQIDAEDPVRRDEGLTPLDARKLFRRHTGLSPNEYRTRFRPGRAASGNLC